MPAPSRRKQLDMYSAEFAYRCVIDPVFFAEEVLGVYLWQTQKDILWSIVNNERTLVQACHASGKSFVTSVAVLWFLYTRVPSLIFTTAPTAKQVDGVVWKEVRTRLANSKIKLPGRLLPKASRLEISHEHYAFGFATDTPDGFQGHHQEYVLGVFDEASGIHPDIWEAATGNLSTGGSRFLGVGNPLDPMSFFYHACWSDPSVTPIIISAYDTPNFTDWGITEDDIVSGEWEEKFQPGAPYERFLCHPKFAFGQYQKYGLKHAAYIARVLGQFPLSSENSLIPFARIQAAQDRWSEDLVASVVPNGTAEIGVDVASGEGEDQSVICIQQKGVVVHLQSYSCNVLELADEAARLFKRWKARVVRVDVIGVGDGTVRRLRELKIPTVPVNVGHKSRYPRRFFRLKAEGWWETRERFMGEGIAIPPNMQLEQELASILTEEPETGLIKIESKDKLREKIGRSPDHADALMLACFSSRGAYGIADGGVSSRDQDDMFREAVERQANEVGSATVQRFLRTLRQGTRR